MANTYEMRLNMSDGTKRTAQFTVPAPTAEEVGARPNTWMPTAAEVGATPASHATNKNNPHEVTAVQVGARPDTWMPTAAEVGARPDTWTPSAADVGAVPASTGVQVYSREAIGASPNFDNPGVNGLFEIRTSSETTGETGTKPKDGFGAFLNLKTPDNVAMMQIAGFLNDFYIRAKQGGNVTLSDAEWNHILTNKNFSSYAAPSGYGLGSVYPKAVSSADYATENGFYSFPAPAISGLGGNVWGITVSYSSTYKTQILIDSSSGGDNLFVSRIMYEGAWGEWKYHNPPLTYGVEYATDEMLVNSVVYVKRIHAGQFPASGNMDVLLGELSAMPYAPFREEVTVISSDGLTRRNHLNRTQWSDGIGRYLGIEPPSGSSISGYGVDVTIWYTKD